MGRFWPMLYFTGVQSADSGSRRSLERIGILVQVRKGKEEKSVSVARPLSAKTCIGMESLVRITQADMGRVAAMLQECTTSDVTMIRRAARQLIASGGKRLRPMLTLAAAQLAGYRGDGHIALAAALELIHTATLLHDDVVDRSEMRRASPTARSIWGGRTSVFVGDFLFGQALRTMGAVGSMDALDVMSRAVNVMVEGEVKQLCAASSLATREEDYLAVIHGKTAVLFAAACEVGPALAGLAVEERAHMSACGLNLGLAFQLIDDALDYSGNEARLGKRVGDDFRDRKMTLPIILAYERGSNEEKIFWRRTIEQGAISDQDLDMAIHYIQKRGALDDTVARAYQFANLAKDAIKALPAGEARAALLDAIDFCVNRTY